MNLNNSVLLNKAATYASRYEHCESEVREKLASWGATDEEVEAIIEYLVEERYIDNQRYANSYTKDKFRFNHWGKYKIGMMLRAKNIGNEEIDEALGLIDEEEYLEKLQQILKDKLRSLKYSSEYEKKGKLFKFAQSRGFESSAISKVIDLL
jgi:regulatory protein